LAELELFIWYSVFLAKVVSVQFADVWLLSMQNCECSVGWHKLECSLCRGVCVLLAKVWVFKWQMC